MSTKEGKTTPSNPCHEQRWRVGVNECKTEREREMSLCVCAFVNSQLSLVYFVKSYFLSFLLQNTACTLGHIRLQNGPVQKAKSEKQVTIQRTDKKSKQTAFVQKYYNLVHYLTIHMWQTIQTEIESNSFFNQKWRKKVGEKGLLKFNRIGNTATT